MRGKDALRRFEGTRPEAGPHRVTVHDRLLDDHIGANRHELVQGLELVEHPQVAPGRAQNDEGRGIGTNSRLHLLRDVRFVRHPLDVRDTRVHGKVLDDTAVDREHLAMVDQIADRTEEQRAPTPSRAGLDDPVRA